MCDELLDFLLQSELNPPFPLLQSELNPPAIPLERSINELPTMASLTPINFEEEGVSHSRRIRLGTQYGLELHGVRAARPAQRSDARLVERRLRHLRLRPGARPVRTRAALP